jgi:Domain of unknown function (DUF4330)
MSIVDDRGRLLGRVNVLDAVAAILLFVLIPVAYGAYLLFRTPAAKVTGVFPPKVYQGRNLRVQVTGTNLRPFMRVAFNTIQGRTFMIGSTTFAEVDLPDLEPGVYDVTLYDYAQEVDRLPKALTVLPLSPVPTVDLQVSGSFKFITSAAASKITPGLKLVSGGVQTAEVLSVGTLGPASLRLRAGDVLLPLPLEGQVELPAVVRVRCFIESAPDGALRCMVPGPQHAAPVAPHVNITLPGPEGWVSYQIASIAANSTPVFARARVRFSATAEAVRRMKVGDVDNSQKAYDASHGATLTALPTPAGGSGGPSGTQPFEVTLRIPVEWDAGGWTYKELPLKIGKPLSFETVEYAFEGVITDVTLPAK